MKLDQLTEIFVKQGQARKDGASYALPAEVEVTLFVALAGETVQVPRVVRLEVADPFVYLDTARSERFVLGPEDVRLIKIDRSETARHKGGAGFNRVER
jgi:hypothetical protein